MTQEPARSVARGAREDAPSRPPHDHREANTAPDGTPDRQEAPRAAAALSALLNAQERMLNDWAEASYPGQYLSERQQELWRGLHYAAERVRELLATGQMRVFTPVDESEDQW